MHPVVEKYLFDLYKHEKALDNPFEDTFNPFRWFKVTKEQQQKMRSKKPCVKEEDDDDEE